MNESLQDRKDAIIEIIEDYREQTTFGSVRYQFYDTMIDDVQKAETLTKVALYDKIVDDWIDY